MLQWVRDDSAGSFTDIKASLAPKERESGITAAVTASVAQFLFPFVFTIIFSNFVVSILVETYLSQRGIANSQEPRDGNGSSSRKQFSTVQVCSVWAGVMINASPRCICDARFGVVLLCFCWSVRIGPRWHMIAIHSSSPQFEFAMSHIIYSYSEIHSPEPRRPRQIPSSQAQQPRSSRHAITA